MSSLPGAPKVSVVTDSQNEFEQALNRETLLTERLRVTILAAAFALALAFFAVTVIFLPGLFDEVFRGRLRFSTVAALLLAAIVYEALTRLIIDHYLKTRRPAPLLARYLFAGVETSLPTALIVMAAGVFGPVYALVSPPLLLYFVFIVLAALHLDFALCLFTGLVAAGEYLALAWFYLGSNTVGGVDPLLTTFPPQLGRAALLVFTGLVAGLVARQIKQQFIHSLRAVQDRNRVVGMFGQHVSPEVVDRLLMQDVDLEGEVRHVCLLFLDIRDFTTFSEKRSPEEVVQFLNGLFEFMIDSVNRNHGIVNKFLGDGFMAAFGAPLSDGRDVQNAVAAGREIVAELAQRVAAGQLPPTRIGLGLHAGQAVTGNVGSKARKEYTIIGDVVNLAARIEQLNKQYQSTLLISEAVYAALDEETRAGASLLGPVQVKGHEAPVVIYQLA